MAFNVLDFLKYLMGSSALGVVIGFVLGKWGASWEENKLGDQLLRNLLQEVGSNRFKCQAVNQNRDPMYFERLSWDNLRLHKAFLRFSKNQNLVNELYHLYLLVDQANLRVAAFLTAIDAQLRVPNTNQQSIAATNTLLRDLINAELLPKLNNFEGALSTFLREQKVIH